MRKIAAWFHSHPLSTIFLGVIVAGIGAHLFANWRAEIRWQRYAAEARARGVKLTLPEFARPEIPDEENFAALPMLRAAFAGGGKSPFALPTISGSRPQFGDPLKGERIDWAAWQRYFQEAGFLADISTDPIRETLRALEHYAPQFQEWSQWRIRPRSRFALDLKAGAAMPLPHLGTFMDASKVFCLKMRAHLALGESAAAYAAFREGWQAYQALKDEPTLICGLVRIAVLATLREAVGVGLRDRAWAEPELRQLNADLGTVRIWEDFRLGMASERGFLNSFSDSLADLSAVQRGQMVSGIMANAATLGTSSTQFSATVCALVPWRVYRDNQLRQNYYFDELLARVDAGGTRFDPDRGTPSAPDEIANPFEQYYYFLSRISAPIYRTVETRYLALQVSLDQARLAVALERCRLARGAFPAALAELVPEFFAEMPRDVFSGQPYRYERSAGGSFRLYSVGSDRRDDGGHIVGKLPERSQPDALWLYAPPDVPP